VHLGVRGVPQLSPAHHIKDSRKRLHFSTQKPRHKPYSGSWYLGST